MKADIEKIKEIFGVTGRESTESDTSGKTEPAEINKEENGYTSHTFTIFRQRDQKRIGILTISDVGEDVKETVKNFLNTLIKDEKAAEDDILAIMLSSDAEDKEEQIFAGVVNEFI